MCGGWGGGSLIKFASKVGEDYAPCVCVCTHAHHLQNCKMNASLSSYISYTVFFIFPLKTLKNMEPLTAAVTLTILILSQSHMYNIYIMFH